MKKLVVSFVFCVLSAVMLHAQQLFPHWSRQGNAMQLVVDGRPVILLAGELGNSSASSAEDIGCIFPKLRRMGLNAVLVPVYWDLIEAEEGRFDFTLVDEVIRQARQNQFCSSPKPLCRATKR